MKLPRVVQFPETENRMVVARGWESRTEELVFKELQLEEIKKMDGGDSYPRM